MKYSILLFAPALFFLCSSDVYAQQKNNQIGSLIHKMTPEEKFWQMYMIPGSPFESELYNYKQGIFGLQLPTTSTARYDAKQINAAQQYFVEESKSGIPIIPFEEALHGLKRPGATVYPQAIALAATWDTGLMNRLSKAVARETRSRGIRQVLSPVVNLATDVRWGRTEETYGEDPYLTSRMAEAFVTAFEQYGIVTTPKHFVANVSDGGRDSWPATLDQRTLMEYHFPPFKAAFDAGARSVMTSYNSVDGIPSTQNKHLFRDILKGEWGFNGFVISDAGATGGARDLHGTEPEYYTSASSAFEAGLDVIFQTSWQQHELFEKSVTGGLTSNEVVNEAVSRILTVKKELGLFEDFLVDPDSAEYWNGHPDHIQLARESAAASMVLLKNESGLLPLSPEVNSIALIGSDAVEARFGGYSGTGVAPVSILEGMRSLYGNKVKYAPGPGRLIEDYKVVPAENLHLSVSIFDNIELKGKPVSSGNETNINKSWTFNAPAPSTGTDWYSIRWEGKLNIGDQPVTKLGMEGSDGWKIYLDGELLIDNWMKRSNRTLTTEVDLEPNTSHSLKVEFYETTGDAQLKLVWDAGIENKEEEKIREAKELAAKSEVAVIVAGIEEGEFRDRAYLGLPGSQEELIEAVTQTGTPVVVVIIGGSAVTMPWLDTVDGVIMAWYPGEQGGNALADILSGSVNPSGRLPITFPIFEGQLPLVYNHRPTGRGNDYYDLTGKPLFPFGFGQSYTTFEYSDIKLSKKKIGIDEQVGVHFKLKNTGERAGHEVVQLYIHDPLASVVRPVIELKGFDRVFLESGEVKEVAFTLGPEELSLINRDLERVVEPGEFQIYIGASSKDLRLKTILTVD